MTANLKLRRVAFTSQPGDTPRIRAELDALRFGRSMGGEYRINRQGRR